jgi:hypothetical protein
MRGSWIACWIAPAALRSGEIDMASPAIQHAEFQRREFSVIPDFHLLSELQSSLGNAIVSNTVAETSPIPTPNGLKGAKSAMVAIGLEAATALCVYGVWQAWHILR